MRAKRHRSALRSAGWRRAKRERRRGWGEPARRGEGRQADECERGFVAFEVGSGRRALGAMRQVPAQKTAPFMRPAFAGSLLRR